MVNITIDGIDIKADENDTILEAAKKAGIHIPHLCYFKGINEIGACKVCVVKVEGKERLTTSCSSKVEDKMVIKVYDPRVIKVRKMNVEMILSQHNCNCPTCIRSGNCSLQKLANDLGILDCSYNSNIPKNYWNKNEHLIRDDSKCIKCLRCIQVCDNIQSLNVWDVANTGSRTTVSVRQYMSLKDANCSYCGQCVTHCPVGALHERDDLLKVYSTMNKTDKIMIAQVAPSVRVAWGEYLGLNAKEADEKKLVTALKKMGFDYVFDTNFAADLTIMEEGSEFLHRFSNKKEDDMPMFTSCCPAWVSFCKSQYPEYVDNLSTAKSPQQMFSAVIKNYYSQVLGVDPSHICVVSFMPCIAKKDEISRVSMDTTGTGADTDIVITTRELVRMIRRSQIDIKDLKGQDFDNPLGMYSGAGVIFGNTGGVMEAALRTAYHLATGKNVKGDEFKEVRGQEGVRIKEFDLDGKTVKIGITNGLANARKLIDSLKRKEISLDFVEVMACPSGCVGGGGQPIKDGIELGHLRADDLYHLDEVSKYRCSHENPQIIDLYNNYLGKPLGEKAHHLLHVKHH